MSLRHTHKLMTTTITDWYDILLTHERLRKIDDFDMDEIDLTIQWSITIDTSESSFNLVINIESISLECSAYDMGYAKWHHISETVTRKDIREWNVELDDMEIKSSNEIVITDVEIDFESKSITIENT